MDIKRYDIVEFHGERYRVMYIDRRDDTIYISDYNRWIDIQDVHGDEVLINTIPLIEKRDYPSTWIDGMGQMINGQVYTIREHDALDNTYLIGHFWFAPYHLTKIKDYDMI